MNPFDASRREEPAVDSERPRLLTRRDAAETPVEAPAPGESARRLRQTGEGVTVSGRGDGGWRSPRRVAQGALFSVLLLALMVLGAFLFARHWVRSATRDALPAVDGSLAVPGLSSSVLVRRDGRGVPFIRAESVDDLVLAQGFVTAEDRLFQMDLLRRHAAGELAEVLGGSAVAHDKLQRMLQIRAAADRAVAQLPADQLHLLEQYARGVNAAIAQQTAELPIEFRVLRYQPAPWTPRDSMLVSLAMFEDLTNTFPAKLARESLSARLPADLVADLYPVGSWRDHPPAKSVPDLTLPGPPIEQVPLDESQAKLERKRMRFTDSEGLIAGLRPLLTDACGECIPGSNNWVVSGAHTASGKPLLANDMHLNLTLPGLWYEADLQVSAKTSLSGTQLSPSGTQPAFHTAGVSLPGLPLIVVGRNEHIAWGFTNLGADVQDVYIEQTRGAGQSEQFLSTEGSWQPVVHLPEVIKVRHGVDIPFEVLATRHGEALTPILNAGARAKDRTLSLRWTLYDPAILQLPLLAINRAYDWPSFLAGMATFGGPAQNVVYADDAGHIGFHAIGRIPMRGPPGGTMAADATIPGLPSDLAVPVTPGSGSDSPTIAANPDPLAKTDIQAPSAQVSAMLSGPLSPVPLVPSAAHEWAGYIPFDRLPQIFDPPGGIIATANARTAPDDYAYPITEDWGGPYRNERIWSLLAHRTGLKPADMLVIQTDIYSDFDHVLGQRLAYALDHAPRLLARDAKPEHGKAMHQAADLLRSWDGRMSTDSAAAAIVGSVHAVLWPMLLAPHLGAEPGKSASASLPALSRAAMLELNRSYDWGERDYALEQILMHTPPRWLPPAYTNWDDFLAAAVDRALVESEAPSDLASWRYGTAHTVDIEHPIFDQSALLRRLLGMPTGTGAQPLSGDGTTVKQVGHTFGPSERFTADLGDADRGTLNVVLGQSGNPASPWFLDQFEAWYKGTTFAMPFTEAATSKAAEHTLRLLPR